MLPRERRLSSPQFVRVLRQGHARADGLLMVRALPNGLEVTRFGFSVGKKLGKAVARNRIKRRLRAAARSLPVGEGWDIVVVVRREAAGAPFEKLHHSLSTLLGRAGVLEHPGNRTHNLHGETP